MSGDGSIVVGDTFGGAFRSVSGGPLEDLSIGGPPTFDFAFDISSDGSTIVGVGSNGGVSEAAIWREGQPVQLLGVLSGSSSGSDAKKSNAEGTIVVGRSGSSDGSQGYRWVSGGTMLPLGDLPGGRFFSDAIDVSDDGSIVVGQSDSENGSEAFIWTEAGGMQSLQVLLATLGVDLTGWQLEAAYGISSDGTRIAGFGTNPDGNGEAFLAIIPEPGTAILLGLGLVVLTQRRER